MSLDQQVYRQAMGRFATGVTVITAVDDGVPFGMTANSMTSVSLNPTLLLVSFIRGSATLTAVKNHQHFGVSVLTDAQEEVSSRFASKSGPQFEGLDYVTGPHGVPLFADDLAHFICKLDKVVDGGDHEVVFGEVLECAVGKGEPLLFYQGKYRGIASPG